jgi:hypothetical protein
VLDARRNRHREIVDRARWRCVTTTETRHGFEFDVGVQIASRLQGVEGRCAIAHMTRKISASRNTMLRGWRASQVRVERAEFLDLGARDSLARAKRNQVLFGEVPVVVL